MFLWWSRYSDGCVKEYSKRIGNPNCHQINVILTSHMVIGVNGRFMANSDLFLDGPA